MNWEIAKLQTFGVEIEMTGLTRKRAAMIAAMFFETGEYRYIGTGYDTWVAIDLQGREWKFMSDGSIHAQNGEACEIAVLEEGMQYKPISLPPEDSQFLSTREFDVEEICRMFQVPPHLVQDLKRSTFNNIEHQGIAFVQYSLMPLMNFATSLSSSKEPARSTSTTSRIYSLSECMKPFSR